MVVLISRNAPAFSRRFNVQGKMRHKRQRGCNLLLISFEQENSSFPNAFMWMSPECDLPGVYEDYQAEQSHLTGKRPRHSLQLLTHEL